MTVCTQSLPSCVPAAIHFATQAVCSLVANFLLECDAGRIEGYTNTTRLLSLRDATVSITRVRELCKRTLDPLPAQLREKVYFVQVHRYGAHTDILDSFVKEQAVSSNMRDALWNIAEEMKPPHAGTQFLLALQTEHEDLRSPTYDPSNYEPEYFSSSEDESVYRGD